MLDRREVVVVNPEPVMTRPANSELTFDATAPGRRSEALRTRKEILETKQEAADESASRSCSCKAVVAWTQIPEIWTALERRFA
jgi:hypothetical protein